MRRWRFPRNYRAFLTLKRKSRRHKKFTKSFGAFTNARARLPVSGTTEALWATAISLPFEPHDLPAQPAALAVRLRISEGFAGIGWYDADGLAEEIYVGPGPCTRTIHLTL